MDGEECGSEVDKPVNCLQRLKRAISNNVSVCFFFQDLQRKKLTTTYRILQEFTMKNINNIVSHFIRFTKKNKNSNNVKDFT